VTENSVVYLTVAFVLAEGINVWACWLPAPFSDTEISEETLKRGKKAATIFSLGYGAAATFLTGNLAPLIIAVGFNVVMSAIWTVERQKTVGKGEIENVL
jgi:hypothetical protein